MKAESLNALLIDCELGELTPEAVELLEAWLAEHPQRTHDASNVEATIGIARATVRRFPELGRPEPKGVSFRQASAPAVPLALAACLVLLLGISTWAGFRMGRASELKASKPSTTESAKSGGPWARYALASGPQGGLTVVRKNN
jgi:anti-sigma factor RsiW